MRSSCEGVGGLLAKRPHIRQKKLDQQTGTRSALTKSSTGNACHDHPEDTNATSFASAAGSGIVTMCWGTQTTCTFAGPAILNLINYRGQGRSCQYSKTFQALLSIFEVPTNSATRHVCLGRPLEKHHQESRALCPNFRKKVFPSLP